MYLISLNSNVRPTMRLTERGIQSATSWLVASPYFAERDLIALKTSACFCARILGLKVMMSCAESSGRSRVLDGEWGVVDQSLLLLCQGLTPGPSPRWERGGTFLTEEWQPGCGMRLDDIGERAISTEASHLLQYKRAILL